MNHNVITKWLFICAIIFLVYITYQYLRTRHYISIGVGLAESAVAYEQHPDSTMAGPTVRILTIGDSSVVGTGSSDPRYSVAGRLGTQYPTADISNLGVNGTRTHELLERLKSVQGEQYDLVLIHTGGNDIVHFTAFESIEADLRNVLDVATTLSDSVVVLHGGNIGSSKLFPAGTRWIFTYRTKKVREIFTRVSAEKQIYYVDLFREGQADPFVADPKKYYAADYFHPSADGYGDWYQLIAPVIAATPFEKSTPDL